MSEHASSPVSALVDAFMAAWDPRADGASEHAVESMRAALVQTGWLSEPTDENTAQTEGHYCLTCGSYQCPHAHASYVVPPGE